jgi:protein O-mannosyl-transferase
LKSELLTPVGQTSGVGEVRPTFIPDSVGNAIPPLPSRSTPAQDASGVHSGRLRLTIGIHLLLVLLVWAVFGQTVGFPFVQYDDQTYVYRNAEVSAGITGHGIIYAFTHADARNWHPLTTISHMLDCQLFGLRPAGHHFTNLLLHAATVLLLFAALKKWTGALWRSAFVAAVFAIHPLRAESVAWIAERKDVLSGLFFMLTVGVYASYVRRQSLKRYLAVALFFVLGLMAKPMLVTLPLLLLVLDYWPLRRFQLRNRSLRGLWRRLILEKIPLLALSLLSATATLIAQRQTVGYGDQLPFAGRLCNGLISCVAYVWQMIWPANLAVFYPYAGDRVALWQTTLAFLSISCVVVAGWRLRKRSPYLIAGFSWYLITLLPVIGLVQVGLQGRADRYTYLPQIGLYVALTWGAADLAALLKVRREIVAFLSLLIVGLLAWCGAIQTSYWKNTETLWMHAVAVAPESDVARYNVAAFLMGQGRLDDAIEQYEKLLQASADRRRGSYHLSVALIENSLGNALARKGLFNEAIVHYRKAIELREDYSDAHTNLAAVLVRTGQVKAAIGEYKQALAIPPEDAAAHLRLAQALLQAGRNREALSHYRRALQVAPYSVAALNAVAWVLATSPEPSVKNPAEAVRLAEAANRLGGAKDPFVLRTLAASYAASDRFPEAVATARHALQLGGNLPLADLLRREVQLYDAGEAHPASPNNFIPDNDSGLK